MRNEIQLTVSETYPSANGRNIEVSVVCEAGIDGDQWYVHTGAHFPEGLTGFGSTLVAAISDFKRRFGEPVPVPVSIDPNNDI